MDCRTNGLSDQWTVGLFNVRHCCHSPCCYSVYLADKWTVGPMDCRTNGLSDQCTVWFFKVCHCCHSSCCYSVDMSDRWTVGPMDCRTNVLYSSLTFVTSAIHPAAIQYICRTDGLSDQDRQTNGLTDQWTVWLFNVCHCCHQSCCYSVDMSDQWTVRPMDCRTNGLSDQWTAGPMDCRTNGLSDQWTVGPAG